MDTVTQKVTTRLVTATAESTKALTGLVTVNNANKIATRLVYDTLRVELVWANRIKVGHMSSAAMAHALPPKSDNLRWLLL